MRRRLQIIIGVAAAAVAFAAVVFLGRMSQPPTYDVAVLIKEVPAFTKLEQSVIAVDTQSLSPAVAAKYVQASDLDELLTAGSVTVENLHPGQPLLRVQVASGAKAQGLSRLAVALTDPERVIVAIPVKPDSMPAVVPGDVVALFTAFGQVQAQTLVTNVIETEGGPLPTPEPLLPGQTGHLVTTTVEARLPLAKWLANGIVYKLNREQKENPNYGAPGTENEPRYIEGDLKGIDVVVRKADAEWIAFALAHGKVQLAVLPAVTKPDAEAGTLKPSAGVTWTDLEERFWQDRPEYVKSKQR